MNASDQLAYQIGRTILDLHIAKQTLESQQEEIAALREQVAELTQRAERTPKNG